MQRCTCVWLQTLLYIVHVVYRFSILSTIPIASLDQAYLVCLVIRVILSQAIIGRKLIARLHGQCLPGELF